MNLRPATLDDVPALLALDRARDELDRITYEPTEEEWREDMTRPHTDLERDSIVVEEDGRVIAVGRALNLPSEERQERAFVYGIVHPEHRGRGIGSMLVEWQVDRASEILRQSGSGLPKMIRTWLDEWLTDARALYEAHGFSEVRWFDQMLRDLAEPIPEARFPEGLELTGWDEAWSERARLAHNAAFADHWGTTPIDQEEWQHRQDEHGARHDLDLLAVTDCDVAGYLMSGVYPEDWNRHGRKEGWVLTLGVVPAWRKQGLASFLLAEAMRRYRAERLTHAALVVDYDSETGADRLYARMGFATLHRSVNLQREPA